VHWKDHGGKVDTCSFITLDGFVVPGRFLFGEGETWRQGVRSSMNTERPFMFQRVEAGECLILSNVDFADVHAKTNLQIRSQAKTLA
jgi:hypothetical protein